MSVSGLTVLWMVLAAGCGGRSAGPEADGGRADAAADTSSAPDAGAGCDARDPSSCTSDGPGRACGELDEAACQATAGCVADRCDGCGCTADFNGCRAATDPERLCIPPPCATKPTCSCSDLDETRCASAAGAELGCTVVYCNGCNDERTYAGCAAADELIPCPAVACAQTCRGDAECINALCVAPDESLGCGDCRRGQSSCVTDTDCAGQGEAVVCGVPECACEPVTACVQGCQSDAECGEGQACDVDHRCRNAACSLPADCPENFLCADGFCARQPCDLDSDCATGPYCVEGHCFPALGQCTLPPP